MIPSSSLGLDALMSDLISIDTAKCLFELPAKLKLCPAG